jgi:hypothetical protein
MFGLVKSKVGQQIVRAAEVAYVYVATATALPRREEVHIPSYSVIEGPH